MMYEIVRHDVTVYHNAQHLGIVHLLNRSTIDLDAELVKVRRFCRVVISKDLVLVVLLDRRLSLF